MVLLTHRIDPSGHAARAGAGVSAGAAVAANKAAPSRGMRRLAAMAGNVVAASCAHPPGRASSTLLGNGAHGRSATMHGMPERRTGRFLGLPYDWRRPTWERLRRAVWNPDEARVLVRKSFGWGYGANLAAAWRRVTRRHSRPARR